MASSEATFPSFDQVTVVLLSGATVVGRCLPWEEGRRFLRLRELARAGSPSAINEILDEFPKAAGIERQRFTSPELFGEVLDAFLFRRGPGPKGPAEMATAAPETVPASMT